MNERERELHVQGRSLFVDDMPAAVGELEGAILASPLAHGQIRRLDTAPALAAPGVHAVLTAADIPGENQIGTIIQDEPLLAEEAVHYQGQPLALVLADTRRQARLAARRIVLEIEEQPALLDAREAFRRGELIAAPRTFLLGDVEQALAKCDLVVDGRCRSGGQEHFYLEPQSALVHPREQRGVRIHSSTQSPTAVQKVCARVLGLPMHEVEVDTRRLGGAFGGKEDQATPWAALAALGCWKTGRPVRLVLDRRQDMLSTGKRHPYDSDFTIGLNREGDILAYRVFFYQNAGAAADLSTSILERSLFHATGSYFIPNVRVDAACCRTNLVPFTAFRGFGGPQAMFVMEAAIQAAADKLGVEARVIQGRNLLKEGDVLPYGMEVEHCRARACWTEADKRYSFDKVYREVSSFNEKHSYRKQGVAIMPICFGISFTNISLNQARALVHVYNDGSVGVSSGAVEMGQGVNAKIAAVAARTLGIGLERIKLESTNTTRVANTSPTAASSGSDLNGMATQLACDSIRRRLQEFAATQLGDCAADEITISGGQVLRASQATGLSWEELVDKAYWARVCLSAQGHYATPRLYFDRQQEKGQPFAYHVYGTALCRVTLDCLRGSYSLDQVQLVHDSATSLAPDIDLGQIEGALVQGLGWMTVEELQWDEQGRQRTGSAAAYKIPDMRFGPQTVETAILEGEPNPYAVLGSKAVGEPPFMYGIAGWFALYRAMRAFRPKGKFRFEAPLTPEKILTQLYDTTAQQISSREA